MIGIVGTAAVVGTAGQATPVVADTGTDPTLNAQAMRCRLLQR